MPVEGETRSVGNGMGTYKMVNGKLVFRITSMAANKGKDNTNMKLLREARSKKNIVPKMSPKSARIAFSKFYNSEIFNKEIENNSITNNVTKSGDIKKNTIKMLEKEMGKKIYKKRTVSPKIVKGSLEAKKLMQKLRDAKAKKRENTINKSNHPENVIETNIETILENNKENQ